MKIVVENACIRKQGYPFTGCTELKFDGFFVETKDVLCLYVYSEVTFQPIYQFRVYLKKQSNLEGIVNTLISKQIYVDVSRNNIDYVEIITSEN